MSSNKKRPAPESNNKGNPKKVGKKENESKQKPKPKVEEKVEEQEDQEAEVAALQAEVEALSKFQDSLNSIDDEIAKEYIAVEQKYVPRKQEIYNQRNQAIKKVKNFWSQALKNFEPFQALSSETDEKLVEAVEFINIEDHKQMPPGFKITVKFGANPVWNNQTVSRDFTYGDDDQVTSTKPKANWPKNAEADGFFHQIFVSEESESAASVANAVRDDLWKDPILCFLGMSVEDGDDDDDEEDNGDVQFEEDDEEDDA